MNFRTILLASAAVMFTGSAMAADITSPFYLPGQNEITSQTSIQHSRVKAENNYAFENNGKSVDKSLSATEEVVYGVTDNFAVRGEITNYFDNNRFSNNDYNNDHNLDYTVGARYNLQSGNLLSQFGLDYYTFNPKSFFGHRGNDSRWYKQLDLSSKIGYDLGNGLTPYAEGIISSPIDQKDRPLFGSVFAGVHKYMDSVSLDGGIRYTYNLDGHNTNDWFAEAEANYFLNDKMAVGAFGSYYLGGSANEYVDYGYEMGAKFKVLF